MKHLTSNTDVKAACITANMVMLDRLLLSCVHDTACAVEAMHQGDQNLAIGTLMSLEHVLPKINTLTAHILLMQRTAEQEIAS